MSLQVIKKIQLKRVLQILLKIDQQLNGTLWCNNTMWNFVFQNAAGWLTLGFLKVCFNENFVIVSGDLYLFFCDIIQFWIIYEELISR